MRMMSSERYWKPRAPTPVNLSTWFPPTSVILRPDLSGEESPFFPLSRIERRAVTPMKPYHKVSNMSLDKLIISAARRNEYFALIPNLGRMMPKAC
jgi:hypothetical protein